MKRTTPLRRTGRLRPARYRAVGRPSLPRAQYRKMVDGIKRDCGYRCENTLCRRHLPLQPAHFPRRSKGAPDDRDHIVMLDARCHRSADEGHEFTVEPQGGEVFVFVYRDTGVRIVYDRQREANRHAV